MMHSATINRIQLFRTEGQVWHTQYGYSVLDSSMSCSNTIPYVSRK